MKWLKTFNEKAYMDFFIDLGIFLSMNLTHIQQSAKNEDSKKELDIMMNNIRKPLINGKNYFDIINSDMINNPKIINPLLSQAQKLFNYVVPILRKHSNKDFSKRIETIKTKYLNLINN